MLIQIAALILIICPMYGQDVLTKKIPKAIATFNSGGVTGTIKFTETPTKTTITGNLHDLPIVTKILISEFPVDLTLSPSKRCYPSYVGDTYNPFPIAGCQTRVPGDCMLGNLKSRFKLHSIGPGKYTFDISDTTGQLILNGLDSIVGRSLVIEVESVNSDELHRICATIQVEEHDTILYTATFFSPVAGKVFFQQSGQSPVSIYGSLSYTRPGFLSPHGWYIRINPPKECSKGGTSCCSEAEILGHYDPLNTRPEGTTDADYKMFCSSSAPQKCELGDLTTKFGTIKIDNSSKPHTGIDFFFTDTHLTLSGSYNILGHSLAIDQRNNGPIIACAPIVDEQIMATTFFGSDVTIKQRSIHESSLLILGDNYPSGNPSQQILAEAWMTNSLCSSSDPPLVESYFFGNTPDLYHLGDLTRKYKQKFSRSKVFQFTELPLYGKNSLLGKTIMTITEVNGNNVSVCESLTLPINNATLLVKGTFHGRRIKGGVYMVQNPLDRNGNRGVANIIVDLYYTWKKAKETTGHRWLISGTPCSEVGATSPSIYNPYNVATSPLFASRCTNYNTLSCQGGDLSRKHSTLTLSILTANRPISSFTDTTLQLSGFYTVEGKSLVILGKDGSSSVIGCSPLVRQRYSEGYNITFSTPATEHFDRVEFLNSVTSIAPLNGVILPSNIVIFKEIIGGTTVPNSNIKCATFLMQVWAKSTATANMHAEMVQSSLCDHYTGDPCLKLLPDYRQRCQTKGGALSLLPTVITIFSLFSAELYLV